MARALLKRSKVLIMDEVGLGVLITAFSYMPLNFKATARYFWIKLGLKPL